MLIDDEHVAALRAALTENPEEYERLAERIARSATPRSLDALFAGAFVVAVYRRFGEGYNTADIIRFVAHERTRFDDSMDDFDPHVAEQMILAVLGSGSIDGMEDEAKAAAQIALLAGLVEDEGLDDSGLDGFIDDARKAVDQGAAGLEALLRQQ